MPISFQLSLYHTWYDLFVTIAFTLPGDVPIYTFSLLLGIGASAGLGWVAWQANPEERIGRVNAGLWALLGGLGGGRAVFAAVNWAYFREQPLEIVMVFQGGLSWSGALGGGVIALVLTAALTRQPLGEMADDLLPLLVTVTISIWLAGWLTGSAYGRMTEGLLGAPAWDEWGRLRTRWPTQLLGALMTMGLFAGLDQYRHKIEQPGRAANFALLGLSLILLITSFWRVDPVPVWRGLRLDTWAGFGCTVGSLFIWLGARGRR